MSDPSKNLAREIFADALELATIEERERYLAQACGADPATVQRIRRALRGDDAKRQEAYLNAKQVAARLDWHPKTVLRHAKQLRAIHRSKRCVRFPVSAVERFEAEGMA